MSAGSRRGLLSPWLTIRAQFVLAAVFVVAGVLKIADPPGFAHEIHNYDLFPEAAVNAAALVLPWVEVVAGLALFFSLWRRAATGILGVLLLAFSAALSIDLARGRPVDCGCFGTSQGPRTQEQRLSEMKLAIARDALLLLLVVQILAATRESFRWRRLPAADPRSQLP